MPIATSQAVVTATIANGGTLSDAVDLGASTVCGLILPAAFTGTGLSFQVSADGVTYVALYDSSNTAESMTVTQGRAYSVNPSVFAGWQYAKVVSNAAEGASRAVTLVVRPV